MKRNVCRELLCATLLTATLLTGIARAEDKNALKQEKKTDLKLEGKITALDATAGTVTVQDNNKAPMTFTVAKNAMFFVNHKKGAAALTDFKVGEKVTVLYRPDGGATVCRSMWQPGANATEKQHKIQEASETK